jgi:DNA polymerase elongation subunit (family B)
MNNAASAVAMAAIDEDKDLIIHLLDVQSFDQRIEREDEETKEVVYESANEDDDDDEIISRKKRFGNSNSGSGGFFQTKREFIINLFGNTPEGRPVRVSVSGFRPSFFIALPEKDIQRGINVIKEYLRSEKIPVTELGFTKVFKKKFYGFTAGRLFPFLCIDMPSLAIFRNIKNLFLNDKLEACTRVPLGAPFKSSPEIYEANIDPMLRFFHFQNISPSGWICIKDGICDVYEEVEDGEGDEEVEDNGGESRENGDGSESVSKRLTPWVVDAHYEDILPVAKAPKPVASFMTASWDIECYSITGDFPVAKRTWSKVARKILEQTSGYSDDAVVDAISIVLDHVRTAKIPHTLKSRVGGGDVEKAINSDKNIEKIRGVLRERGEFSENKLAKVLDDALKNLMRLDGDPVIQIGTVLTRGHVGGAGTEIRERHIFVFPDCSPIDGAIVHVYPDERTMITEWYKWIVAVNPDILVGYNIFGFDERYLWERSEDLGVIGPNSPVHGLHRLCSTGSEVKLEEKFLSSSALGDNYMYVWSSVGRLQVDLYHYIRRSASLPSYKLDDVTKNYMSGKMKSWRKVEVEGGEGEIVLEFGGSVKDIRIGRAIVLLDETGEELCDKIVIRNVENGGATIRIPASVLEDVDMTDIAKWVIVKDDVSPQDIFRLHRGNADDRAIVGAYCIQDCDLVLDLYKKLETYNNAMSMANVCSVPVSYIFMRGQGIKIESLMFKGCRERGILIPVLPNPNNNAVADSYEGAIVLDPVPGFYSQSPIGVADFASLYPSTIISENISHDSLVWVKDFDESGKLICHSWGDVAGAYDQGFEGNSGQKVEYGYTDIEFDLWRADPEDMRKNPKKKVVGRRICRYAQPLDGTKSTVPEIIKQLLSARAAKRVELKKESSAERKALLDAEQNAYKVTANSLYGQLGSGTFKIRLQHLAASTTAYGRKQIMAAKAIIESFYGPEAQDPRCRASCEAKIMYGDSVTGDTPLFLRVPFFKDPVVMKMVELEKMVLGSWKPWHETKEEITVRNNIEVWTEAGWTRLERVIRHRLAPTKKMYRIITRSGMVECTEDHSLVAADGKEIRPSDIEGCVGDGVGCVELLHNSDYCKEYDIRSSDMKIVPKITYEYDMSIANYKKKATDKYIEIVNNGYYGEFGCRQIGDKKFLTLTVCSEPVCNANTIVHMEEIWTKNECQPDVYVYDLQTANHHFSVGPGALVVHNTDSLFVEFNPRNPETGERLQGRDARQAVIDLTAEAGHFVTNILKPPHDFEFDKVFDPMLMFSKKRYAGKMFEENADDFVYKYMGIALKRRDNAQIVKTIFGGAMKKLLNERDVVGATELVKNLCMDLVNGKASLGQLTITKSLRADYADPSRIAHKALADRMTLRDPGNAPAAGDRIPYIYIQPPPGQQAAKLQGERIEHPAYIREKGLLPDYSFYISNQITNPVSQMFGLLLEQMPGFDKNRLLNCPADSEKRLDWCEKEAANILFSECLQRCAEHAKVEFVRKFFGGGGSVMSASSSSTNIVKKESASFSSSSNNDSGDRQIVTRSMAKNIGETVVKPAMKQMSMSSFLMDKTLISSINKVERKNKKTDAVKTVAASPKMEENVLHENSEEAVVDLSEGKKTRKKASKK